MQQYKNSSTHYFLCGPCRNKGESVGLCVPLILLGNGSVNTLMRQRGIFGEVFCLLSLYQTKAGDLFFSELLDLVYGIQPQSLFTHFIFTLSIISRYLVTIVLAIGFIEHLTESNYDSLTKLHIPKITVTVAHMKSFQFSLAVALWRLLMADVPLPLGSRTVPVLSYQLLTATVHNN
jgi:hypothetical protein